MTTAVTPTAVHSVGPSGENLGTQNCDHDCSREHEESSFETVADLHSIEEPESPDPREHCGGDH